MMQLMLPYPLWQCTRYFRWGGQGRNLQSCKWAHHSLKCWQLSDLYGCSSSALCKPFPLRPAGGSKVLITRLCVIMAVFRIAYYCAIISAVFNMYTMQSIHEYWDDVPHLVYLIENTVLDIVSHKVFAWPYLIICLTLLDQKNHISSSNHYFKWLSNTFYSNYSSQVWGRKYNKIFIITIQNTCFLFKYLQSAIQDSSMSRKFNRTWFICNGNIL